MEDLEVQPSRSKCALIIESVRLASWPLKALLLSGFLLPTLLAAIFAWHQKELALQEVHDTAKRSVIALEEHASNVLQTHSLILHQIARLTNGKTWGQINGDAELAKLISELAKAHKQVALIGIVDTHGSLRVSSLPGGNENLYVGDRDYFTAHQAKTNHDMFVSEVYTGRVTGVRQFAISIPRFTPSGDFDGVIFATVALDYFTSFWEQFTPTDGYLVPLIREDGVLMVRYPAQNSPSRLNPDGPFLTNIRRASTGLYTAVSQVDNIERINAYRQIENFPLYISYSVETRVAFQKWRDEMLPVAVMAILTTAALVALCLLGILQSHKTRLSARKWQEVAQELQSAVARREQAEEALRHGQKMEAIGQLTGGIAHDFNNLLAGISGNLELMDIRLHQGQVQEVSRYITSAKSVTDRAAALTHRLLAFSRRQALHPKLIDVNSLISSLLDLLHSTVGPAVEIRTNLDMALRHPLCDPHQLENALLNLVINARDASPNGGEIRICTKNTVLKNGTMTSYGDMPAGKYVTISVTDNGIGMSEEILRRACDPFFTTKPVGEGTGLGLSMVHGFVRQSGGYIDIRSEPAKGTTIDIHLLMHFGEADALQRNERTAAPAPLHIGARVLVVEDEAPLRALMVEVLREHGCAVFQAPDAQEALDICKADPGIELLITDIGLPGAMNGQQLAEKVRAWYPSIKLLFITGYGANHVTEKLPIDGNGKLLRKPFLMTQFSAVVGALVAKTRL
jgi:signal transduction histidine kinase